MATRTPTRSRGAASPRTNRTAAARGRSASSRSGAQARASSKPSTRRTARPRGRSGPAPLGRLARAVFRLLRFLWVKLAVLAGAAARGIGHSARDLDPAHRR
ncbi:MAG: hypothetical protein ACRDTP_07425, partial [Mycobacteriales bacterium]